jgi:multiple sugar transport system substrate-binding protein
VSILQIYRKVLEKSRAFLVKLKTLRARKPGFLRSINRKNPQFKQALQALRERIWKKFSFAILIAKKSQNSGEIYPQIQPERLEPPGIKRIDWFLFAAAAAVMALIAFNFIFRTVAMPKRTDIFISPQCEVLFGKDIVDKLIRDFEEQKPELRVRRAEQGVADLIFFEECELSGLLRQGALSSLTPYIHTETQSGQWAIPLVSFMDLFFYNIPILMAAGLDRPPKNRVEFLAAARAAAKLNESPDPGRTVVYGTALGLSPGDPLGLRRDVYSWIWAAGGDIRPPETADGQLELSRAAADTIAFFGQLNREGLLAPGTFDKTGAVRLEEFAEGKIAMMTASSRDISILRKSMNAADFGITTIPAAAQGKTRLGLLAIHAGISSECAKPDEAWAFLAFLAEQSQTIAAALGAVPGSLPGAFPGGSFFAGEYITEDPLYSKAWDIFEAADLAEDLSGHPQAGELEQLIREKLALAFEGKR